MNPRDDDDFPPGETDVEPLTEGWKPAGNDDDDDD